MDSNTRGNYLKEILDFTGPVIFEIGSKRYELELPASAARRFETAVRQDEERRDNIGVPELAQLLLQGRPPKFSDLTKFFWASAKSKNAVWTLERADEVFDQAGSIGKHYNALLDAVFKVLVRDYADPEFVEAARKLFESAEQEEAQPPDPLVLAPAPVGSSTTSAE